MAIQLLDGKTADRPTSVPVRKPRRVWSSNTAVVLWGTLVGKKVVMAVTGLVLVGFVIVAPNGLVGLIREFLRVASPAGADRRSIGLVAVAIFLAITAVNKLPTL